jgi:ferritin-like metal-binding protein YciE
VLLSSSEERTERLFFTVPLHTKEKIMSKLSSLKDLYVHELQDLHSAEEQIIEALPQMAAACKSKDLKKAFEKHLKESEEQKKRIEEIASSHSHKNLSENKI